jgi:dolichyl-diphosphooligosaccharide--protein glycosyltransferase
VRVYTGDRMALSSKDPSFYRYWGDKRVAAAGSPLDVEALFSALIGDRVATDPRLYRAARWMRAYADDRGRSYPESYVFSRGGRNRMFNYVVNGQSRSYTFARENYEAFVLSSRAQAWYRQLRDRTGFVVTTPPPETTAPQRPFVRLHEHVGSATDSAAGVAHYRAVYSDPGDAVRVFTLVPGATLTGRIDGDGVTELRVRTTVTLPPTGRSHDYVRRVRPQEDGSFRVTVANPGRYAVTTAGGQRVSTVIVPARAVTEGRRVRLGRDG